MDSSALLGPLANYTWDYYVLSLLVTFLGVVAHYIKKCVREKLDWVKYWTTNKGNSLLVIFGVLTSYFGILLTDPNPSMLTFISISYMIDSMLNKDGGVRAGINPINDEPTY